MAYKRFLTKAIIWEVISNLAGGFVVYVFTGDTGLATAVTVFSFPLKLGLYVIHEKAWSFTNWGRQ